MNKCEYCSSHIDLRNSGGVHLWGVGRAAVGWEETVVYKIVDEIVKLTADTFTHFLTTRI